MKASVWILVLWSIVATGCAVMPKPVEEAALPAMPLAEMIQKADQYRGKTAILGGYVLEVKNLAQETRLIAIQAPLDIGQRPKAKDYSQGRLVLTYKGFLDPEVYTKNRVITVAGVITGSSATRTSKADYPYVALDVTHIHLWAKEKPEPRDPYWDYWDPWGPAMRPYPWWWRHPYYR